MAEISACERSHETALFTARSEYMKTSTCTPLQNTLFEYLCVSSVSHQGFGWRLHDQRE